MVLSQTKGRAKTQRKDFDVLQNQIERVMP